MSVVNFNYVNPIAHCRNCGLYWDMRINQIHICLKPNELYTAGDKGMSDPNYSFNQGFTEGVQSQILINSRLTDKRVIKLESQLAIAIKCMTENCYCEMDGDIQKICNMCKAISEIKDYPESES